MSAWISTFTGRQWFLMEPREQDVCIEDIAHALAHQCRFNGHCREFYSVAQHSVHVYELMNALGDLPRMEEELLAALLHDASEAYMGDMVRPLKQVMPEFAAAERKTEAVIWRAFGLNPSDDAMREVKRLDNVLLATERRDLIHYAGPAWVLPEPPLAQRIRPWSAATARAEFLRIAAIHGIMPAGKKGGQP